MVNNLDIKSIIAKKRNKGELDKDEIRYFVGKYSKGEITDAQASALLSYIYINGLTEDEIMNLSINFMSILLTLQGFITKRRGKN